MRHTSTTERLGKYLVIITDPENNGIFTVEVMHNDKGLIYSHTDGGLLKDFLDYAHTAILNHIDSYLDEIESIALHDNLVLSTDDTDYLVTNQDGFVYGRFRKLAELHTYCLNNGYTGFATTINSMILTDLDAMKEMV